MIIEFIESYMTEIIAVVSASLVSGQGFFILFKNLKTNKNIDAIDKVVGKLIDGDLKDVTEVVKVVVEKIPDIIEEFKKEMVGLIENYEKSMMDQQEKTIQMFQKTILEIEGKTKKEIERLNIKNKLNSGGHEDEDVLDL